MRDPGRLVGCGTALVTPFKPDQSIDESALRRLVEYQIRGGVDFLVPCGTTGESVTMSEKEQAEVVSLVIEAAAGRVPVVAGAGGYNTREIIERVDTYTKLGADAILSVTPYYNKPTQEGLYQHFRAIAESSDLGIILYNVPGRTSCNLEPATVERLSKIEKIIGIKEASGNISQIGEIATLVGNSFKIFAGDDSVVLPVSAIGGVGVVSVASNLLPREVSNLTHACLEGKYKEARELARELTPLFKALFVESSPIPIKAAMAMHGLIDEVYRLPLVPPVESTRKRLTEVLAPFTISTGASVQAKQ
jgi:4-hydroxy-tetrahydrodipicolinate synthase